MSTSAVRLRLAGSLIVGGGFLGAGVLVYLLTLVKLN
jgi:hypothetical protein